VLIRHYGFGEGYPEAGLGNTDQTSALILDRLSKYMAIGEAPALLPRAMTSPR
jgi:hypothetical protein